MQLRIFIYVIYELRHACRKVIIYINVLNKTQRERPYGEKVERGTRRVCV